ncbi:MAG: hybrid sensor histidine kinase/response regulator [Polyangiaceae bacterium]
MPKILHIEDDPRNRLLVRKLLMADGHEVVDAVDGLEGVRLALTERPDLVLVDLNLPGLDGYEVTLRLRAERALAGLPIVAITAEGDRDTSLSVGCNGFLQKPIDARVFGKQVAAFLGGHRERMNSTHEETHDRLRAQGGRIVQRLEKKVEELSGANARLRDIERLRTEFYRNVSHELATPLTPIVGYLRMLIDQELGATTMQQAKALRAMDDCVRRLRNTLDNLVDVTSLETDRMKFSHRDYDFMDVARRALAQAADRFEERKQTVLEEMPRGPLPGYGDPERLLRALGQLLDNANKFSGDGAIVGAKLVSTADAYEFIVADNGPGIAQERRERVFEPFYQEDGSVTRAFGGTGVGLAIARRIARGHGGDVTLVPSCEIEGMKMAGAVFLLRIAKRAPLLQPS